MARTRAWGWFVLVAVAIVLAFTVSSYYAQRLALSIRDDAGAISNHAMPSVERLTVARSEMRGIDASLRGRADPTEGHPTTLEELAAARSQVDEALAGYLRLQGSPGEAALHAELSASTLAFLGAADKVARARAGDRFAEAAVLAETELHPAFERASAATLKAVQLNAEHARQLALSIESARQRSRRMAYVLDLVNAVLAGVLALLAVRVMRRQVRIEAEHRLILERRAHELEQFAGRVAHDVISPLTAVGVALGYAAGHANTAAAQRVVARGSTSLRRVRAVVDGLYDFARSGAAPDLHASCEAQAEASDAVSELLPEAEEAGVELRMATVGPRLVATSAGVLNSLLQNLLRNAVKFTAGSPIRRVELRVKDDGDLVRFEVEDTGPGIPEGLDVWSPYVRGSTQTPGMGIGLATVKRLAEAHGGQVGVRSTPGAGSCFWFTIPKAE